MALLDVTPLTRDGIPVAAVPCDAAGDEFSNHANTFIYISNQDASSKVVSFIIQTIIDGQSVPPRTVTVLAGQSVLLGPYPANTYNDTSGLMSLTYDAVTSLSIQIFRI